MKKNKLIHLQAEIEITLYVYSWYLRMLFAEFVRRVSNSVIDNYSRFPSSVPKKDAFAEIDLSQIKGMVVRTKGVVALRESTLVLWNNDAIKQKY